MKPKSLGGITYTIMHEMGHIIGLNHWSTPGSIMSYWLYWFDENISNRNPFDLSKYLWDNPDCYDLTPGNERFLCSDDVELLSLTDKIRIQKLYGAVPGNNDSNRPKFNLINHCENNPILASTDCPNCTSFPYGIPFSTLTNSLANNIFFKNEMLDYTPIPGLDPQLFIDHRVGTVTVEIDPTNTEEILYLRWARVSPNPSTQSYTLTDVTYLLRDGNNPNQFKGPVFALPSAASPGRNYIITAFDDDGPIDVPDAYMIFRMLNEPTPIPITITDPAPGTPVLPFFNITFQFDKSMFGGREYEVEIKTLSASTTYVLLNESITGNLVEQTYAVQGLGNPLTVTINVHVKNCPDVVLATGSVSLLNQFGPYGLSANFINERIELSWFNNTPAPVSQYLRRTNLKNGSIVDFPVIINPTTAFNDNSVDLGTCYQYDIGGTFPPDFSSTTICTSFNMLITGHVNGLQTWFINQDGALELGETLLDAANPTARYDIKTLDLDGDVFVYVAKLNTKSIDVYQIDTSVALDPSPPGVLTLIQSDVSVLDTTGFAEPNSLSISEDSGYLYVTLGDEKKVAAYAINKTGVNKGMISTMPVSTSDTITYAADMAGINNGTVFPMYVSNQFSFDNAFWLTLHPRNSLNLGFIQRDTSGDVSTDANQPFTVETTRRFEGAMMLALAHFFEGPLSPEALQLYTIDPVTGRFNVSQRAVTSAGQNPHDLLFSQPGPFQRMYVLNRGQGPIPGGTGGSIMSYSFSGTLTTGQAAIGLPEPMSGGFPLPSGVFHFKMAYVPQVQKIYKQ